MEDSKNFVICLVPTSLRKTLLDKLEYLKWQIRFSVIAIIIMILLYGIDMAIVYDNSSKTANFCADAYNGEYVQENIDANNYVAVNDELSIQMAIRRAGEEEWQPCATVASRNEIIEIRVLAKTVLPIDHEAYDYPVNIGRSDSLSTLEQCENIAISETYGSEEVTYIQEMIFRSQVTTEGWWKGQNAASIGFFSDDLAEVTSVYAVFDFGYISKTDVFVPLACVVMAFCVFILGVISRRRTARKLQNLE